MSEPISPSTTTPRRPISITEPRVQRVVVAAALGLYGTAVVLMLLQGVGLRGARQELRNASELVLEKQREVDEAQALLDRRLAELRKAEAAAIEGGRRFHVEALREREFGLQSSPVAAMPVGSDTLVTALIVPVAEAR
jgi:hypothetical protein